MEDAALTKRLFRILFQTGKKLSRPQESHAAVRAFGIGPLSGSAAIALATALGSTAAPAQNAAPARSAAVSWPSTPQARKGAPNILVIITDDVGFAASSTYGGPVPTPTFDALARNGLRYNRFHTTALCSPTRASLLTGRNPHNVAMGNVTNIPTGYPGYTTVIPKSAGTVARILRDNGYNTAMFGKAHVTPEWEMSQAGPFDRWPTGLGFEYFYGFLSADTNQWAPTLVENTRPVEPPSNDPDYFFDKDIADKAIGWIKDQQAAAPDKPVMIYFAPGAAHGPLHAPKEWLARYRGKFDDGWDKARDEIFARQKAMGIIPADAKLTPRPASLPAWDTLNAKQKQLYARQMESFAAALSFADDQVGRVIEALRQTGELDNTMIVYIQGDNGSSAEGGLHGAAFEQSMINRSTEGFDYTFSRMDEIGGPKLYNLYPAAWGWALNTPFPFYKQVASQLGGVRNGMVISWPAGIKQAGGVRPQYSFVSDIMPTILDAAQVQPPATIDGERQQPLDGISLKYSFDDAGAPSRRRTQIFEMMENFGIYHDGWFAGVLPKRNPWEVYSDIGGTDLNPDQRTWQLFNLDKDYSQSDDLAKSDPRKLKQMQALFWDEAGKNNILPIHFGTGSEGVPSLTGDRTRFTYPDGVTRIPESAAPRTIGRSFSISADILLPARPAQGVIVTQGGRFGGYSLYLANGKPVFHYNAVGANQYAIRAEEALPAGAHTLLVDFVIDKAAPGAGGMLTISADGKVVARGRIERTIPTWISHSEGLDIGRDTLTPINDDYSIEDSRFTGDLKQVVITLK